MDKLSRLYATIKHKVHYYAGKLPNNTEINYCDLIKKHDHSKVWCFFDSSGNTALVTIHDNRRDVWTNVSVNGFKKPDS